MSHRDTSQHLLPRVLRAPVAAVRPYLVLKGTLLLLAFDVLITRVSHAGRYGAGGFNVAHWPWLDVVQPAVTPPMHVGACVLVSALCLALVFARNPPRWLIGLTFLTHSWSWAMSMLDSYQHHYLLSLVLLCLAFFPTLSGRDALAAPGGRPDPKDDPSDRSDPGARTAGAGESKRNKRKRNKRKRAKSKPSGRSREAKRAHKEVKAPPRPERAATHPLLAPGPRVRSWAYAMLSGSIGVVYAYTAFSKTAPEWLSGASLQRVMHYPSTGAIPEGATVAVRLFHQLAQLDPTGGEVLFRLIGHSVVLLQLVCMSGYLLAPFRDVTRSRWLRGFYVFAMGVALSFHFGAEMMGLQIGWFGYYMIGYALIFFLPEKALVAFGRAFVPGTGVVSTGSGWLLRAAVVLLVAAIGWALDSSLLLGVAALAALFVPRPLLDLALARLPAASSREVAGAGAIGAGAALLAVGWFADLPGAFEATVIAAALLTIATLATQLKELSSDALRAYSFGALIAALALLGSVLGSQMRWDYWRNVGGDHRRRGEVELAYHAYVRANLYAPEGENRDRQAAEMRAILVQRGLLADDPE